MFGTNRREAMELPPVLRLDDQRSSQPQADTRIPPPPFPPLSEGALPKPPTVTSIDVYRIMRSRYLATKFQRSIFHLSKNRTSHKSYITRYRDTLGVGKRSTSTAQTSKTLLALAKQSPHLFPAELRSHKRPRKLAGLEVIEDGSGESGSEEEGSEAGSEKEEVEEPVEQDEGDYEVIYDAEDGSDGVQSDGNDAGYD